MKLLNTDIYDNILLYIEPSESIKFSLTSKDINFIIKNCNYWNVYTKKYYKYSIKYSNNTNYYKLCLKLFNSCCYICKDKNYISSNNNYTNSYNLCYICKNTSIHFSAIKKDIQNKIKIVEYPFYNLNCYIKYMREQQFYCMISKMNKRKYELEDSFSKRRIIIPPESKLCRNYILDRININSNKIATIICQKKYIYEYTPFLIFKKYYYRYSKSWKIAHKLALKMVLNNNKYPSKFPWETNKLV